MLTMVTIVHTITETSFKDGELNDEKLLRFRDKKTRNSYLKNVVLKPYKIRVQSGDVKPETYDVNEKSNTKLKFAFEQADGRWYYVIKAGIEEIKIIESISNDSEDQLRLEL